MTFDFSFLSFFLPFAKLIREHLHKFDFIDDFQKHGRLKTVLCLY